MFDLILVPYTFKLIIYQFISIIMKLPESSYAIFSNFVFFIACVSLLLSALKFLEIPLPNSEIINNRSYATTPLYIINFLWWMWRKWTNRSKAKV